MDNGHLEGGPVQVGWPVPDPKAFKLADGREVLAPDFEHRVDGSYSAQPTHRFLGAPSSLWATLCWQVWVLVLGLHVQMSPTFTTETSIKIVPLRLAADHGVMSPDVDPRGLPVYGADKQPSRNCQRPVDRPC
jgi:photosynthetic reaction center H subunit